MTKRTLDSAEDLDAYLALAEECARGAGKMIRDAHDARSTGLAGVESKGSEETETVDLVTATDKACEDCAPPPANRPRGTYCRLTVCPYYHAPEPMHRVAVIIGTIRTRYPDHVFIGEESSFAGPGGTAPAGALELSDAPTWIIDPLDGTTNFVHGYPLVTVAIGLAVGKKVTRTAGHIGPWVPLLSRMRVRTQLVLGVIYNPIMDELCSAVRGRGAHLNGRRIRVGSASAVTNALVCNNIGASRSADFNAQTCKRVLALLQANIRGLRNSGSAAQNMSAYATTRCARCPPPCYQGPSGCEGVATLGWGRQQDSARPPPAPANRSLVVACPPPHSQCTWRAVVSMPILKTALAVRGTWPLAR